MVFKLGFKGYTSVPDFFKYLFYYFEFFLVSDSSTILDFYLILCLEASINLLFSLYTVFAY